MALMCRFQRQWADVSALTCSRTLWTREEMRNGTRVTEVGEWGRFQSAPASPLFPWHMRRTGADVMVVHCPNPTAEIGFLIARPRSKLVVRYQSDVVRQAAAFRMYGPIQMKMLRKADMILVHSQAYLDTSPVLGAVRDRCQVLPLGILPEEFQEPDPDLVASLPTRYGGPFVLFSGRHRYYKGLEYLVRAAKEIRASVVLAGNGPERAACEDLARTLGVPVFFPGSLTHDELKAHLHACAVFVFPSVERSEAYGISMLEAHACGKPVVATKLGTGVEFVNLDGVTGINVPPRDPGALAAAVNQLLANDVLRETYGAAARDRVCAEFHAERIARQEFELYRRLIGHTE
ncbi:MAG: glycosyl transferase [Candidatus Hydrogenedentota bacterium]